MSDEQMPAERSRLSQEAGMPDLKDTNKLWPSVVSAVGCMPLVCLAAVLYIMLTLPKS